MELMNELDKLEGVRTRAINRKLRDVMILDEDAHESLIHQIDRNNRP